MPVIINPGTGPVANATLEQARSNIDVLLRDAEIDAANVDHDSANDDRGRFCFNLKTDKGQCSIDMPGLALDRVRYMGEPQNIWNFPRLYVDGSSWVWKFAIGFVKDALNGVRDEDEE